MSSLFFLIFLCLNYFLFFKLLFFIFSQVVIFFNYNTISYSTHSTVRHDKSNCLIGLGYTSNLFVADGEGDRVRWVRAPRPGSVPDLGTTAALLSVRIVATIGPLPRGSLVTTVHHLLRRSCHPAGFYRRSKPVLELMHVHNGPGHCCPPSSKWNQDCRQLLSSRCQIPANGNCIHHYLMLS